MKEVSIFGDLTKALYIAKKDIREYYLKPPTISWGLVFPVAFTLAFILKGGRGIGDLIPGLITMALFFGTTSMASASIVFERKIGSFERLLLFPISYTGIAIGKTLGSFFFGLVSLMTIMLVILPLVLNMYFYSLLLILVLMLSALMFSALGVFISFLIKDPTYTMMIFNSIRFPMIFLCGIFIPVSSFPLPLRIIALLLPLTYSVEAVRYSLYHNYDIIPPTISILIIVLTTIVLIVLTSIKIKQSIP